MNYVTTLKHIQECVVGKQKRRIIQAEKTLFVLHEFEVFHYSEEMSLHLPQNRNDDIISAIERIREKTFEIS